MNIYDMYDWNEINKLYLQYNDWSNEWLKQKTNKEKLKFKEEHPAPTYIKPGLSSYELKQLDLALANIKPMMSDDGKYSATLTLKGLKDKEKPLMQYLYNLRSRSELYTGSGKENARYCALVPLFLAAQKEYNGINYEAWDKTDKFMPWLVGRKLFDELDRWYNIPLADTAIKVARENALTNKSGKRISPASWPYHTIEIGGVKAPAASLGRHIILQTWMANVEHRNEFMILDRFNWDLMPKAYDAVFEPKKEFVSPVIEEEMPF